jgi:uncharacterized protein (TIGR02271 family)
MASTIVGVFDEYTSAREASERLQAMGIGLEDVQITATSDSGSGATTSSELPARQEHKGGIRGFFASLFGSEDESGESSGHFAEAVRRGSSVLTVNLADDSRIDAVSDVLEDCGAIDIDERVAQWKASGYTGHDETGQAYGSEEALRERQKLQVVQEDLEVGKREVDRGSVRVHQRVSERPVEEELSLREERAVIERRPVDRPATQEELSELKPADLEITETAEEPVVSKSARVVEEVSVGRKATDRKEKVQDTVRRSDVEVERGDRRLDDGARSDVSPMAAHLRNDATQGMRRDDTSRSMAGRYTGPERRRQGGGNPGGMERRAGW